MELNEKISNAIEAAAPKKQRLKMLIGLDGFVDEIIHVVDKRTDFAHFERLHTIAAFGEKVNRASGLSMNFEFVPTQVKLGGNGPIFANALLEYGVDVTYVGSVGKTNLHPVFQPMADKGKVYGICEPGHTDALEFDDGKLMLGKHQSLHEITWEAFKNIVGGAEKIAEIVSESDLVGMENWTMIPKMNEIWEGFIAEIFPLLDIPNRPIAFFDLADPEKRTKEDISKAMSLISQFGAKFRSVLGLNEKEVYEIADVLGVAYDEFPEKSPERLKSTVLGVFSKLTVDCLVVHPTKEAVCATKEGYFQTSGPYCAKPALTTGAGDNFNAGFCFALASGLAPQDALTVGVATSGFYVRNAKSPATTDLVTFLHDWAGGKL